MYFNSNEESLKIYSITGMYFNSKEESLKIYSVTGMYFNSKEESLKIYSTLNLCSIYQRLPISNVPLKNYLLTILKSCVISCFRRSVNENYVLLRRYTAWIGSYRRFRTACRSHLQVSNCPRRMSSP